MACSPPSPLSRGPLFQATAAQLVEVRLASGSNCAGKLVAELGLPREAVLISVRRGRDLVLPHGDTRLLPGDVVTALVEREHAEAVRLALEAPAT